MTTALSWRVVFAGEVAIAFFVLVASGLIQDARREEGGRLDWVGGALSVTGLMLIVLGVQQSSSWGWIVPRNPPEIGGTEITPLGLSPAPFVILLGVGVLLAFARWVERRERRGEEPLLRLALLVASLGLVGAVDHTLDSVPFAISLGVMGFGGGLLVSQIGNVIMSSVEQSETSEAGGIQGTFQYLGGALGTALVGAVLLSGLTGAFTNSVVDNPQISPPTRERLAMATEEGIELVPSATVEAELEKAGVPPREAKAIVDSYDDSQIVALKVALLSVAAFVVASFWFTRALPDRPMVAPTPTST